MINIDDTISAVSTPPGEGGIGIVRMSGDLSFNILSYIFSEGMKVFDYKSHTVHYGYIINADDGSIIDEVLVTCMKKPKTYTRQDIIEINCHGGIIVTQKILDLTLKFGARIAEPGEFTLRAFLNGRIDLSEAEAVVDLINAKTDIMQKTSVNQLKGMLSEKVNHLRERLLQVYGHMEALNDFPEDEVDNLDSGEITEILTYERKEINKLLSTYDTGKIVREGLNVVIVGKPNVGKSSLLNAMLSENRAIVTEIPGTTRDVIEEFLNIKGLPVKIIDTAGIRDTDSVIEKIGVEKSLEYIEKSDLILFVIDMSTEINDMDKDIYKLVKNRNMLIIGNKSDLKKKADLSFVDNEPVLNISAKNSEGIDGLYEAIYESVFKGKASINNDNIFINSRHKNLLEKAVISLNNALDSLKSGTYMDLVSIDVKDALDCLSGIVGLTVTDDVLHGIFEKFCIGK